MNKVMKLAFAPSHTLQLRYHHVLATLKKKKQIVGRSDMMSWLNEELLNIILVLFRLIALLVLRLILPSNGVVNFALLTRLLSLR